MDLCNDGVGSNCTGAYKSNSSAGYVRNYAVRYHANHASSAIVGPYDARQIGAVTLFEDADCEGGSGRFYWDPSTGNEGTYYGQEDLVFGGLRDNTMHSM